MKKITLILFAIFSLVYTSCTVEKRHYMSGYHVEWKHKAPGIGGEGTARAVEQPSPEVVAAGESLAQAAEVKTGETVQNQVVENRNENMPVASVEPAAKPTRKEVREMKKEAKEVIADAKKYTSASASVSISESSESTSLKSFASETDIVLLVILAILLPPVAVYLYEGSWTSRCTVNLILTLLCGLPGMIHALIIILGNK